MFHFYEGKPLTSPGLGVLTPGWVLNEHIVLLHPNNFFLKSFALLQHIRKKPGSHLPNCEFHVPWGRGSDLRAGLKWLCSGNVYHDLE